MSKDARAIGRRIHSIRAELGLSMEEFGQRIDPNAHSGTVSNWEHGLNAPNAARIKKIAELGNVSVDVLLTGREKSGKVGKNGMSLYLGLQDTAAKQLIDALNGLDIDALDLNLIAALSMATSIVSMAKSIDDRDFNLQLMGFFAEFYSYFSNAPEYSTKKAHSQLDKAFDAFQHYIRTENE